MSSNDMAVLIADKLRNLSELEDTVTAEEILAKCENQSEVHWWYKMLMA